VKASSPEADGTKDVKAFFASLSHPAKRELQLLRKIILGADPSITERIKWKVPSFRTSEYFATLNLRAKDGIQVILHLGAKAGKSASGLSDPAGLLQWLGKDRALVTFRDMKDIRGRQRAFEALLRRWIRHV
jgi:hypothetical protein